MDGLDIEFIQNQGKQKPPSPGVDSSLEQLLHMDLSFRKKTFKDKRKEGFYLELNNLIEAGVQLKDSIELIQSVEKNKRSKDCFGSILADLIRGLPLHTSMKNTGSFGVYEFHSVKIGEETGRLVEVTHELAHHYSSRVKQKRQLITALTYPAVLITVSVLATSFLLLYMVPMFEGIFNRFGGELPAMTQAVLNLSAALKSNAGMMLVGLVSAGIGGMLLWRQPPVRNRCDSFVIKLPVIGKFYLNLVMLRFFKSMSLLVASKIPLIQCMELMKELIRVYPIRQAVGQIGEALFKGSTLHGSMSSFYFFDPKTVAMVRIGEETNQLQTFFEKIASNYEQELEFRTSQLNTLLEPIIIIFLGLIIGFILVTMYLPMFQLSSTISH